MNNAVIRGDASIELHLLIDLCESFILQNMLHRVKLHKLYISSTQEWMECPRFGTENILAIIELKMVTK